MVMVGMVVIVAL